MIKINLRNPSFQKAVEYHFYERFSYCTIVPVQSTFVRLVYLLHPTGTMYRHALCIFNMLYAQYSLRTWRTFERR